MVHIHLPHRLKGHNGHNGHNGTSNSSQPASRGSSPMRAASEGKNLVLKTTVLRVRIGHEFRLTDHHADVRAPREGT